MARQQAPGERGKGIPDCLKAGQQVQQETGRELAVLAQAPQPPSKLPSISRKEKSKPLSHLGLRGHK
jgi:hypothetical protein